MRLRNMRLLNSLFYLPKIQGVSTKFDNGERVRICVEDIKKYTHDKPTPALSKSSSTADEMDTPKLGDSCSDDGSWDKETSETKASTPESASTSSAVKRPQAYVAPSPISSDGFHLRNPNISRDKEDILYHLALGNKSHDLVEMFGDIKFVCLGGTPHRMERFAYFILHEIGYKLAAGTMLQDISIHSHRYALFKVGPVMSVSHGMGQPSTSILLHELIKLMFHAGVKDPIFFRLGTCGGLGVEPGTVVVSREVLNGMMEPVYVVPILGKRVERPAILDQELALEITAMKEPSDNFAIVSGKTICTDDFYEGQGRLDGAFCHFTEDEKFHFLKAAKEQGVTNIEMESVALAAITHHVGIKSAVIAVTLLNRLVGDQINQSKKTLEEWQDRPMVIAARYIKKYLAEHSDVMDRIEKKSKRKKSIACPDCVSVHETRFGTGKRSESGAESTPSSPGSTSDDASSRSSTPSTGRSSVQGCLPGCSIIVSSTDYLKRVLDESNGVD